MNKNIETNATVGRKKFHIELKPCPCCGGDKPELIDNGVVRMVVCFGCGAQISNLARGYKGGDPVELWNRRIVNQTERNEMPETSDRNYELEMCKAAMDMHSLLPKLSQRLKPIEGMEVCSRIDEDGLQDVENNCKAINSLLYSCLLKSLSLATLIKEYRFEREKTTEMPVDHEKEEL